MATKTFVGELKKLLVREVNGRNGPINAYSGKIVKANGEEYNEWIGFGFKKPACAEGDSIKIVAKQENGFWKAVDVEVTGAEDGEQEAEESGSGTNGSTQRKESSARQGSSTISPTHSQAAPPKQVVTTQQSIHYQNSRTAAIALTDLLLKYDAVPLAATTGKAGKAKKFEEVAALVNKLTVVLFHDLESFRLVKDIEDVYKVSKAETLPEDFDESDVVEEDDSDSE